MDFKITSCCLSILLFISAIKSNDTSSDGETRNPRASGRIVKLYSGVRPDPIVCTDEGFRGDPNNCAVFYRCMKSGRGKFAAFRFQCPPGTVYDPETEVCNHPRSTKRAECSGLKETSSPHYEVNEINEVQELSMPISTISHGYMTLSTPKINPISQNLTTSQWQPSTTVRPISTSHNEITPYPWISTTQNHFPAAPSVSLAPQKHGHEEICTSDGFMGDSVNCHKFYRCVGNQRSGFTKYEFSCSEPTIWDDNIKSCNHAWAVKGTRCGRSNILDDTNVATEPPNMSEQTTSHSIPVATTSHVVLNVPIPINSVTSNEIHKPDKTIQNQLQISYGANVQQTQTQISNNSAIQNQTQINYGDRVNQQQKGTNKQNQNQISYGSAVSQSQTQISYGNEVVQTQLQIDHSKLSSQSQIQITRATTPTSKSTHAQDLDVTQNKQNVNSTCSRSGFMGDYNDCKKFYRCVDNGRGSFTRHEFSCGEGTLWDQTIEACNHAWAVKECGGMLSQSKTTTTTTTTFSQSSTTHGYSTTSNKPSETYYPTTEIIHSDGFDDVGYNNQATSSSTDLTTSTTEIIHQSNHTCQTSGFVGDEKNCQIFYSCVENEKGGYTKYEFKCGEGTLWDPDIGACNHAWAVRRCGGSVPSTTSLETTTKDPITLLSSKVTTSIYTTSSTSQTSTQTMLNDDYDVGYGGHSEQPSSSTIKTTILPHDDHGSNECKSSGFMGSKNDCKKFYRCVDNGNGTYARYEFTCGEGTAWDVKIEGCNHAWAVDCKNNGIINTDITTTETSSATEATTVKRPTHIPESDKNSGVTTQGTTLSTSPINTTHSADTKKCKKSGFMGDKLDCKKFYRCVDSGDGSFIRYEFICGDGTAWDPKIEACNHAWAVEKCGSNYEAAHDIATTSAYNYTVSDQELVQDYPTPGYPIEENEVSDKTTQKTSISTSTIPSSNCKKDGFIGDEVNCKVFYRCVMDGKGGYIKYEFQCGEGTVWDQSIEACNHAWAVKDCGGKNDTADNTNEMTTENLSNSFSDHEYQSTEKTSTSSIDYLNEITEDCKKEGFIGDSRDCKKFYRCVSNENGRYIKYEFACGEGTYWNQILQTCDHTTLENQCKGNGYDMITEEPHHENDETYLETTTKGTVILTTESQVVSSTEKIGSVETKCHTEGFYGDRDDCQKFYRCVDDGKGKFTKYEFTCGDGTVWDQNLTTCAHKSESNRCLSNVVESSSQTNVPSKENEIPHTTLTTNIPYQTPENTNVAQQTSTEYMPSASYKCTSEGFHANPTDCKKFVRCVNNGDGTFTKYDFACGEGTVWVQELLACDHDHGNVSCHTQIEWTTKSQPNFETSTYFNTASSSTSVYTESSNNEDNNITKAPQISNDVCQSEGFFAVKDDCKKYYRCVPNDKHGYTKYDYICGEGTVWDSTLQICSYNSANNSCQGTYKPGSQTESVVHDEISETTEGSTSTTQASTTESMESTNTESGDTCKNEGFFGNNKDCTKFYRCVSNGKGSFTKYDFTCGDGTIWDQDVLTCNHPHDVVNPSCNEDHGESTESTSLTSTTTSTSSTSTQSSQSTITQSSSSTTTQSATSTTTSTESSSNCTQEETSKKPSHTNVTCTKAGYYPDPNDCKKFYRCVDWDGKGERFSVYFFECGEGTIWDPALDTCNHEESVYPPRDCSNNNPQNISSGQQPITTEQVTTQESTTSEKTTTESIIENTTNQQSTTTEKSTTEQSTTSEQTTTQQTTHETTTIEHSTTTEQTTTMSSTSEVTSTQQVDTTTQQITTTTAVTDSSTTGKTTTQESTTSGNTTDTTTLETTSQQSTTENEGSTTESINSSTTTDSASTTAISTTEESTLNSTTTEAFEQTSTTENQQETTTENNSSSSSCPDTDDDQYLFVCPTSFRRHPKYCNLFYQCTEDDNYEVKVAVFNCPNNTIYDEDKIQCVEEDKANKKCDGEISSKHRIKRLGANYKEPIVVTRDAQKCSTVGHMPFEKNSECSPAFLKCEKTRSGKLRGFVHRCPQNYMYWSVSRRCEREEVIRDCKRTINNWSGRWEIPIDRYNVAW